MTESVTDHQGEDLSKKSKFIFLKNFQTSPKIPEKTKTLNVMIKIYIFVRCRGGSAG